MNPLIQRLTESSFHGVTTYESCGHTANCRCGHKEQRTLPGKCPSCEMGLRESAPATNKSTPLPVIVDSRPVEFHRCPHCQQEIYEKHIYEENGVDYHSDCKGAIKLPPTDWSKVSPEWRKLLGGPA